MIFKSQNIIAAAQLTAVMPLSPWLGRNPKLICWYQRWVEILDQKCFQVTGTAPYNGYRVAGKRLMTLQEVQNQALQLPTGDRWQLGQVLLDSLKREVNT